MILFICYSVFSQLTFFPFLRSSSTSLNPPAAVPVVDDAVRAELNAKIASQGATIRKLKSEKASKEDIDAQVKVLLDLKARFRSIVGEDWKPAEAPSKGKKQKNGPKEAPAAAAPSTTPAGKESTPEAANVPVGEKSKEQLKKEAAEKARIQREIELSEKLVAEETKRRMDQDKVAHL